MAPLALLSTVPGRVRLESPSLIGKIPACRQLQGQIAGIEGVIEASVNHRTGRILVQFHETGMGKHALIGQVERLLGSAAQAKPGCATCYGPRCKFYASCLPLIPIQGDRVGSHDPYANGRGVQNGRGRLPMAGHPLNGKTPAYMIGHVLVDLVSHLFLPKSFRIFLPIVVYALERQLDVGLPQS